jgi:spore maturation protein CgeB
MRLLISGTCPAALNSNYGLLWEITRGFEQLAAAGTAVEVRLVQLEDLPVVIRDWRPTATLLVGGLALDTIPLPLVRHVCDQVHSRLVFWSLEDPYELDCVLRQGHWFDLLITSDAASRCFYPGDWLVKHLPLASADRPLPLLGQLLNHPAQWLFCGVPFACRLHWLDGLVQACPEGLLIGPDWPEYPAPTQVRHQRIASEVLGALYASLPLTLYLGRDLNLANAAGVVPSTPGPRLFECAAAGGRQLVCGAGLELDQYYEPGQEVLVAATMEEAQDRLAWSASHPEDLASLGQRAWRRTQAEHLYRHRAKRLLTWIREL